MDNIDEDRLLVFNVKNGWKDECWEKVEKRFGITIPRDEDFPRLNSTEHFHKLVTGPKDDFSSVK